jgi:signal transduction histidine kinase
VGKNFYCLVCCLIFLLPEISLGQGKQKGAEPLSAYHINHYTDENGLPQNSVKSIVSDSIGNIWLATERGLARFDGKHFTIFDHFGSSHSDRSIASFQPNPVSSSNGFFAINNEKVYIHVTGGRAIRDSGFYKKQLLSQPFTDRTNRNGHIAEGLPSPSIDHVAPWYYYLVPTGLDRYFVYNRKNIEYYVRKKKAKSAILPDKSFWDFFQLDGDLYHIENGIFTWYASKGSSFGRQIKLSGDILRHPLYSATRSPEIFWNNCANQVFILLGKSLYALYAGAEGGLISRLILEGFDFQANKIKAVYYDPNAKRIFLGSPVNGLYILKRKPFHTYTADFKGTDNVFYGQAALDSGSILSAQGVILSLDRPNGKMSASQLEQVTRVVGWDKSSILVDRSGRIWCKHRNSFYLFKAASKVPEIKWDLPGEISLFYEGKDGKIWIGTRTAGLYYIDPTVPGCAPRLFIFGNLLDISFLQQQSADILWVATQKGLYKVMLKNKRVFYIRGLEKIYIRSLHISEDDDRVWITSYKDGLFLLNNNRLTHFPLDKQMHMASAHCIVEDRKGFFWITTNKGLLQVLKEDLLNYTKKRTEVYYHYYSKADGLNSNEFNGGCQPCAVRLPTGLVSLPSMNGLVWFKPEQTSAELPDKAIIVDRIEIDGESARLKEGRVLFKQDQKQLRLYVTTPYFGNPNNVNFSYALTRQQSLPSGPDWIGIDGADDFINILRLSKGSYALHVRKKNGFRAGDYEYKTLTIIVPPLWHETWWFYSLCGLLLLLMALTLFQIRLKSIKKRNVLLENLVTDRTKALNETLGSLEESQSELLGQMQLQSRLMASIAHDVRTPLHSAIVVAGELRKMITEQQYDRASIYGKHVEEAMQGMKNSLEDLLAYVKAQVYKKKIVKEEVALSGLIEKNFQLYGKAIKNNPNTFVNDIAHHITVFTSPQLLDIIIHNLVDNANKFTENGVIRAYTEQEHQAIKLIIEDSGKGMPEKLFTWFAASETTDVPENYHGIGLLIVKEIAPLVSAGLQVAYDDQGTRFTLLFPPSPSALQDQAGPIVRREHLLS